MKSNHMVKVNFHWQIPELYASQKKKNGNHLFKHNIRAPNGEFYLSYTYQAMINIGNYTIGTHKLKSSENFYPVGEPCDYFLYYNKFAPILINNLTEYEVINKYHTQFKVSYYAKNKEIIVHDELIILIQGKIFDQINTVFLSGKNKTILFEEDTYILHVFNIPSETYSNVNLSDFVRGWLIGNFYPSIQNRTDFEIGSLQHKKGEVWGFHYHKKSIEINILIDGLLNINNQIIKKNDIFIFNRNVISCPLFLEDSKVICIKIPSEPNDKYII